MRRRDLLGMAVGTLVTGAFAGRAAMAGARSDAKSPAATVPESMTTADFHAARKFAATRSAKVAYVERGTGKVALFLHGFPLNGFQWRGALERLSAHRRCIAPDFMGLGYTEVPEGQGVAPAAQVEMLREFLDKLSITSVDLVANDSGGAVAQMFVTRYPKRVRTLLLTNCDVENDSPPPAVVPVIEMARAGAFAEKTFLPQLADKNFARSAEGIGGLCFSNPAQLSDATIDCYFKPLVSSKLRIAQTNAYAIGLDPNPLAGIEPALKRCMVPARIVWGTADPIFSAASPDYLDRILPKSRGVRRVAGAKLFYPEEFPDLIAEEARQLWGVA